MLIPVISILAKIGRRDHHVREKTVPYGDSDCDDEHDRDNDIKDNEFQPIGQEDG